jgi:TonB-linked SusC/RagA family outer membrane protein
MVRGLIPMVGVCMAFAIAAPAAGQATGSIRGTVTAADSREPLSGVWVSAEGTRLGGTTQQDGAFLIVNVPVGTYSVVAQFIGYADARRENVRVVADGTAQVDLQMRTQALSLEEIVVTGVTDPIAGVKLPFTVGTVNRENLVVPPTSSAAGAIQGKIAGAQIVRGSGQPGAGVSVVLRTPTSITRSNSPMYVVDGVVLGSTFGGTTADLESLDIEKIEVVKGAAAAALYGSRAAAGVISITTSRGSNIPQNQTRITVRSEIGQSELPNGVPLTRSHFYLTDAQGRFLDENGDVITSREQTRVTAPDRMMDKTYGVPTYNAIDQFFRPGRFLTNSGTLAYNNPTTNFLLSLNNYQEKGIIQTNDGYERRNVRFNLDHRLSDMVSVSTSMYHNRSYRDELSGDPFWDTLMFGPEIDLSVRDDNGQYIQQPDPLILRENPLWRQTSRDNDTKRARTLISGNARVRPLSWLSFSADMSYDRSDINEKIYVPKGVPVLSSSDDDAATDGRLQNFEVFTDTYNAAASANVLYNFGALTTRTTLRALMERETYNRFTADARDFWVADVPRMDVARQQFTSSFWQEIRASGYFWQTGFDYDGKYIADVLLRRDGSSLFGPDARWHTYYRTSLAWRMAEEPWWPIAAITEFKPRYSRGTAGGRPSFSNQYETWTISSSGQVSKGSLGNRNLRPELTTEQEYGADIIVNNRVQLQLTYATQVTDGQLIEIPQPAASGYSNQWQNSGELTGHTYEATVEALLVQRPNLSWSSTFIADRSRSRITEWNRVCYFNALALRCQDSDLTKMWGDRFLRSFDELPSHLQAHRDQFVINDDGYLVAVGPGGDWQDGDWGSSVEIEGMDYKWGHPVVLRDSAGSVVVSQIGDGNPDMNLGWINNVRWGGFMFNAAFQAQFGFDVYNRTKQRLYQHFRSADLDQAGKPAETKKPIDYYQALYNTNNVSSHFVEDASYVKMRELSVRYAFGADRLARLGLNRFGTERITLGLIGRNLWTLTDYTGYDPEVGSVFSRQDNFAWPNTRTVTANIEITF